MVFHGKQETKHNQNKAIIVLIIANYNAILPSNQIGQHLKLLNIRFDEAFIYFHLLQDRNVHSQAKTDRNKYHKRIQIHLSWSIMHDQSTIRWVGML